MQVVLVDDDPSFRRTLCRFMQHCDLNVLAEAGDGQEALSLLDHVHPDLIITDCQMPHMDGMRLVRTLRARGDATPIVMLSGQGPAFASTALKAGVDHYVSKPFDPQTLRDVLHQIHDAAPARA